MSRAREVRTKDARRVLAETRITRPILSSIRKALHQKYYNLHKRDPNAEALRV